MQEVTVRLDAFAHGGEAVGSIEDGESAGKRIFVRGALPGETVRVGISADKKRYAKGITLEVLEPSQDRVSPPCAVAESCGGCNWQHLSAERQAEHKAAIAASQLREVVSKIDEVHPSPNFTGYRRRARLHVHKDSSGVQIGFFSSSSNDVVPVSACPVLSPELSPVLAWLGALEPYLADKAQIHLLASQSRVLVGISGVCPRPEKRPELVALLEQGPAELCGIEFRARRERLSVGSKTVELADAPNWVKAAPLRCGPFDFAQAQDAQNQRMLELVAQQVPERCKSILELYCGAGNLTRVLASPHRKVEAWDDARGSIEALRRRVVQEPSKRVLVHGGTALKALRKAKEKGGAYDLLVVDPPRTGLGGAVVKGILALAVDELIYVSCDPATLARDLKLLQAGGYRCDHAAMVDMMPMTSEIEMVVKLKRG